MLQPVEFGPNGLRPIGPKTYGVLELCSAAYEGDFEKLESMLDPNSEKPFIGMVSDKASINDHVTDVNALHAAAMNGQTECVDLLLEKRADPHVRSIMPYGKDPRDGSTARMYAEEEGFDDIVDILSRAERTTKKGVYLPEGPTNNWRLGDDVHGIVPKMEALYAKQKDAAKASTAAPRSLPAMESTVPGVPAGKRPVALLFPDQGSEYAGMLKDVMDMPGVQQLRTKAQKILGYDLFDVCLKGDATLEDTKIAQPAVYVSSLAAVQKLFSKDNQVVDQCMAVCGLSLGEYTALTIAGVWTFEVGLKLVMLRAEAMDEAAKMVPQGMVSVAGLDVNVLQSLCRESSFPHEAVQIANYLFPKGFVCAGAKPAVDRLQAKAEKAGAMQSRLVKINGAFHTPFMKPAQEKLKEALREALPKMKPSRCNVYFNSTGRGLPIGTEPEVILRILEQQLEMPVLWHQCVDAMKCDGVTDFCEVGPQKQLKAVMKRIDNQVWEKMDNIEV